MLVVLYDDIGRILNIVCEKDLHILSEEFNDEHRPLSGECAQGPV